MRKKQRFAETLAKIREKVKSQDLEGLDKLLTTLETNLPKRLQAVQVISTRRRPAAQVLPTGRYPSGEIMPTTWRPAFQVLPSAYFEDGVDTNEVWDKHLLNFRTPTSAELDTTISANIKRFQLQPKMEEATDSGPEEGIGDELWEHESPKYLILQKVTFGKLNDINFSVDPCLLDMNTDGHSLQYPELNYDNQLYIDSIPFFTEIAGEIFNSEITVKGQTPSYLAPGRKNLRSLKLALKGIMALPDECGCELYNDLTAWFKHWAFKSVELYNNRAYIEFNSKMVYPGSF